jgi:hypothetical protein
MVSLSLAAVPIFAIQLVLGKLRLLLTIAFYLSLCGLRFQRFVRMFSASHLRGRLVGLPGLGFYGLFLEVTLLRRMDVLARNLSRGSP